MSLFLLTFFLIYGGVHVYAYLKAKHALGFGAIVGVLLACFMMAMVLAPMLVYVAERRGMEELARLLAYGGYVWMGALFLFFSAGVVIDMHHAIIYIAGKVTGNDLAPLALSSSARFFIPLACACVISIYGALEAGNIGIERVVINTSKLPPGISRFKIVQISDVHLGLIVREKLVGQILNLIKQADPDLLISTGDFVDGQIDGLSGIAGMFSGINPPFGKFAVTGNHEFYAGLKPSLAITEQAGFRILRGGSATVAEGINIAGVDDPAINRNTNISPVTEHLLLAKLPRDKFTLLLKHRPKVEPESVGLFDLQLSGHVHKGQIFPFNLLTHMFYPVKMGVSRCPENSFLYVSRGTGTWGPPIRFLSPPEVTIIELVSEKQSNR